MSKTVRVIDLFAGCGGLSLGFDLYKGTVQYQTVMALDNHPPAVKCFNANSRRKTDKVNTARQCDMNWFSHPCEVLLYYLTHYAFWQPDRILLQSLEELGVKRFLADLVRVDAEYRSSASELAGSGAYTACFGDVDGEVFKLAIGKSFLSKMAISSLKTCSPDDNLLPWRQEAGFFDVMGDSSHGHTELTARKDIAASTAAQFDGEVAALKEASLKEGRGQHVVVGARVRTLVTFLEAEAGKALRKVWVHWQSRRNSIRAQFCSSNEEKIAELYTPERRVHLILGGPPCKGFSRIGRAVIRSLRDQGAHAWTSHEYGDERNALMHKFVLFLEALKPNVFLFENVSNFESVLDTPAGKLDAAEALSEAIDELSTGRLHFDVRSKIVRAKEYAVPQDRERFIMVGFNMVVAPDDMVDKVLDLPTETTEVPLLTALGGLAEPGMFRPSAPQSSARPDHKVGAYTLIDPSMPPAYVKYLRWIRQPDPTDQTPPETTDAHIYREPRPDDLALMKRFAPGQRWMDYKLKCSSTVDELRRFLRGLEKAIPASDTTRALDRQLLRKLISRVDEGLLLRLIMEEIGAELPPGTEHHFLGEGYLAKGTGNNHGDWFERMSAERPSKTIVAHIGKDTYGFIHPFLARPITMREAARIQSFPDFFSFSGIGIVEGYAMIGNAVPPLLANCLATKLAELDKEGAIFSEPSKAARASSTPGRRLRRPRQMSLDLHQPDSAHVGADC